MIALSGCIGKPYHLLLPECLTTFLIANKLVDPTLQKAFLPGINGCIEHNTFGRVSHTLIDHTLERNFIPHIIRKYFHDMYTHSIAVVESKTWKSDPFKFNHGVFQGYLVSPVIFLLVFNPIL